MTRRDIAAMQPALALTLTVEANEAPETMNLPML
jgi:hypothetical protein